MAKVYYVKEGSSPHNLVDPFGRRVALAELKHRLQDKDRMCREFSLAGHLR
jgi:hypothetical protein